jgi:hypothetical protein
MTQCNVELRHALERLAEVDEMMFSALHIAANSRTGTHFRKLLEVTSLSVLVLYPGQCRGFRVTAINVITGGQLHALLAAELTQRVGEGEPPSQAEIEVFRGDGPQMLPRLTRPTWATFTFDRLLPDMSLPAAKLTNTAEDLAPARLPMVDSERILLIGGAPHPEQNWRTERTFDRLKASVTIDEELDALQVEKWLKTIAEAAQRHPPHDDQDYDRLVEEHRRLRLKTEGSHRVTIQIDHEGEEPLTN